ncbi:MAG: hypothetical protein FD174_2355 [Geobacteraceae bacterium]|nr:MAG: hypothetical protein FD174_2355 [Geobacteraceae bacterium]
MKKRILLVLIFSLGVMNLFGCGFGGFSDSGGGPAPDQSDPSNTDTIINGVVSKGIFKNGTIRVYAVNTDGSETLLKTNPIGAFGNYSANIGSNRGTPTGSYSGVVLIKASGTYIDEATGSESAIDDSHPLRAAVANPSGELNAAVTPLTELAARKALAVQAAGKQPTAIDVNDANALVSDMFKVDIIATQPVMPDKTEHGFGNAATTQAQKDYTLALAAISQMAKDAGALSNVFAAMESDIADGAMSVETATAFNTALINFLKSDINGTGVKDINSTNLVNVGGATKIVKIGTAEKVGAGAVITGITVTLQLPPGVTVKADFSVPGNPAKVTLQGVVTASGVPPAGTQIEAAYTRAAGSLPGLVTLSLGNAAGFVAGEFVTITCDLPAGASLKSTDFIIFKNPDDPNDFRNFRAVDGNGAPFPESIVSVAILPE